MLYLWTIHMNIEASFSAFKVAQAVLIIYKLPPILRVFHL